jgi:hypothetical protein
MSWFRENKGRFQTLDVVQALTVQKSLTVRGLQIFSLLGKDASVFGVDPDNGDDDNPGTLNEPFATLQTGIDACTSGKGDVIVRMPGTENPTSVINFNKSGITVVASTFGADPRQQGEAGFSTYPAASYDSGPVGIITKPCSIIGLEFVTRNVTPGYTDAMTTSGAALAIAGHAGGTTGGFNLIAFCRFVDWWGNAYGIEWGAGAYNLVTSCVFEGFDAGAYFRITTARNPDHNHLIDNHFVDCVNGIEHRAGVSPHNFLYRKNVFIDISGDSIDTTGGLGDGLIAENVYETATDAATYDDTVANLKAAGINFAGNNYSE